MTVRFYRNTDTGAPVLNGTAGSLINILNAVLVDGYPPISILALTRVGTDAIATVASNTTMVTGQYYTISGANESDYNGTFQITVVDATTFTYTVANSPATPATGVITYARAPLGWSRPFTGTNIAVYRSNDNASNRFYLRVSDAGTNDAVAVGFESMTSVSNGTGQFPLATQCGNANNGVTGGVLWQKSWSGVSAATARNWFILGDTKTFYLWTVPNYQFLYGFGHLISLRPGDGFNTFVGGQRSSNESQTPVSEHTFGHAVSIGNMSNTTGTYIARSYTQIGASQPAGNVSYHSSYVGGGYGPWTNPQGNSASVFPAGHPPLNGPNLGIMFLPVYITETSTHVRGRLPGFYVSWAPQPAVNTFDNFPNIPGLPITSILQAMTVAAYNNQGLHTSAMAFFDITGPWI